MVSELLIELFKKSVKVVTAFFVLPLAIFYHETAGWFDSQEWWVQLLLAPVYLPVAVFLLLFYDFWENL